MSGVASLVYGRMVLLFREVCAEILCLLARSYTFGLVGGFRGVYRWFGLLIIF